MIDEEMNAEEKMDIKNYKVIQLQEDIYMLTEYISMKNQIQRKIDKKDSESQNDNGKPENKVDLGRVCKLLCLIIMPFPLKEVDLTLVRIFMFVFAVQEFALYIMAREAGIEL